MAVSENVISNECASERYSQEENESNIENIFTEKKKTGSKNMYKKQKFTDKYKKTFDWLKNINNEKFCIICNVRIQGNAFHIKRHMTSVQHKKRTQAASHTADVQKLVTEGNSEFQRAKLIKMAEFKMAEYLCQHNLPFRLADSLPNFCVSAFPDSRIASGMKMKRKKATTIVKNVLSPYALKKLVAQLQTTRFSIIIDESTDTSTKKSLVVMARMWNGKKVQDRFLDLLEVQEETAQGLFNLIKHNILDKHKIPYKNIIGFAADNAAVMMGSITGVQAFFKKISPDIVVMGCTCHSLHLCASHAAKKLPSSVEQLAKDIYSYFSHSSKRSNELKDCQIFVEEKPQKMLHPSQTRWLSLKVIINLRCCKMYYY